MDDAIEPCPSKNTNPLLPLALRSVWKLLVAENEPYTQLNPPTAVRKPEAIRFTALAVPVNDGLAVGAFASSAPCDAFASSAPCRPEVLAMLSDASGQVKAPVQVRGVLKVLPAAAM